MRLRCIGRSGFLYAFFFVDQLSGGAGDRVKRLCKIKLGTDADQAIFNYQSLKPAARSRTCEKVWSSQSDGVI